MSAPGASAMAELRSACWPVHQRIEKRLDIKLRFGSLAPYRAHLEKMWGFCAGLEESVPATAFRSVLGDYDRRRKVPLLTRDLIALGHDAEGAAGLGRCDLLPRDDMAAAFGCVYVIEGATLGGQALLPLVESQLGLTAEHGASFLASYGADVGRMWAGFGASLEAWCCNAERRASAARAAIETFEALEVWLCGTRA